jgi:hypothetical protein
MKEHVLCESFVFFPNMYGGSHDKSLPKQTHNLALTKSQYAQLLDN